MHVVSLVYFSVVASEPTNLVLKQDGPMKIIVSWDPPSPPGHTTGYRVNYTSDQCTLGTDTVMSISDTTTTTLTGLTGGCYYTVFITGLSEHLPSETESAIIYLGKMQLIPLYTYIMLHDMVHSFTSWKTRCQYNE